MSSSDPRVPVHKPRLPKAYNDQQLSFLRSLPEFERRSQGTIRGDAKKFALERAQDFIVRFGLPQDFANVDEPESRFKEQIYNWFKNTVGRTRRKLEGRPRSAKKAAEKAAAAAAAALASDLSWNSPVTSSNVLPYPHAESSNASPVNPSQTLISPIQYGGLQPSSSLSNPLSPPPPAPQQPSSQQQQQQQQAAAQQANQHNLTTLTLPINKSTMREAFLQGLDSSTVANMVQSFVAANPSSTPLTPIVEALFDAISTSAESPAAFNSREPHQFLRRFLDASSYFPPSLMHAGVPGPLAGPRALQMQIRKHSIWTPTTPVRPSNNQQQQQQQARSGVQAASTSSTSSTSSPISLADEMQRIAMDRQRRKDHIQWARIHAAALELGVLGMGRTVEGDNNGYAYAMGRAFSEMMARDAVWEADEVEWVAGVCVLRAVIRTAMRGDRRHRDEYDELLRAYESRWKEIKDEARQIAVAEILISAKEDLLRLNESIP